MTETADCYPKISPLGLDSLIVSFAGALSDAANLAAISFAAHMREAAPELAEVASALVSVRLRFDPFETDMEALQAKVEAELGARDWRAAAPPEGRRLWRVPTLYGGEAGPHLAVAAEFAGLTQDQAKEALGSAKVRVLALGFAPGQPYLGMLGEEWNLPRLSEVTPRVPAGALTLAIRQFVLFAREAPTGWSQVGRTPVTLFDRSRSERPALLMPGDEVIFEPVSEAAFADAEKAELGGAVSEVMS